MKLLFRRASGERIYAAYVLGLLGLRRGEVLGLRCEDIDWEARTLSVRQTVHRTKGQLYIGPPKSKRSRRTLPLPPFVLGALRAQRIFQSAERKVAGDRWLDSGRVVTSRTGTILEPRNVPGSSKVTFHGLRHSLVSLLLALGTPPRTAMEIAGHSGLDITMNTYGHVRMDGLRDALGRLGTLFSDYDDER